MLLRIELVSRVRTTLQIVPECMFKLLGQVMDLLTHKIPDLPTRLEKDKLKDYARPEERFRVAQLTNSISVFAQGILLMKTTLVGIIELDPKRLLEDGIRKELVKQLATALHVGVNFNAASKTHGASELKKRLALTGKQMEGFRKSFEYMQVCSLFL